MNKKELIIVNYIEAYNNFDVQKMVQDFSDDIMFQNVQNGEVSMTLHGLQEFIKQAELAKNYFVKRRQTILSYIHEGQKTEVEITYFAELAVDFPNGLKKGQELQLKGKSIFEFKDNKIIRLTDVS